MASSKIFPVIAKASRMQKEAVEIICKVICNDFHEGTEEIREKHQSF
jgi:hypothetical protein